MPFLVKTIISALIISLSTTLAKKNPSLGGLILALPIVSIIAFAILGYEGTDPNVLKIYAKSTLVLVPISLVFFVPFVIPFLDHYSFLTKFSCGLSALIIINLVLIKTNLIS